MVTGDNSVTENTGSLVPLGSHIPEGSPQSREALINPWAWATQVRHGTSLGDQAGPGGRRLLLMAALPPICPVT